MKATKVATPSCVVVDATVYKVLLVSKDNKTPLSHLIHVYNIKRCGQGG